MTTYMPKSEAEQLRVCHLLESMNCSYQITHGSLEIEVLGAVKAATVGRLLSHLEASTATLNSVRPHIGGNRALTVSTQVAANREIIAEAKESKP